MAHKLTKQRESTMEKPTCKLVGTDGNVFAVIGNVSKALRRAKQDDKVKEFSSRAMQASDYYEVFAIASEYVEIK